MVNQDDQNENVEDATLFPVDPATAPPLWLERCDLALARRSVRTWHYSHRLAAVVTESYAVRERGRVVGVVVFGAGSAWMHKYIGVGRTEVCELARVALGRHVTPTSRIVAIALRLLRRDRPGIRAVVSFADTAQGHHGGIYQANGWLFCGSVATHAYRVNGQVIHGRTLGGRYGVGGQSVPWLRANLDPNAERVIELPKHRYVYPFDPSVRAALLPRVMPYPKRLTTPG